MRQIPLAIAPEPSPGFDTFVVGANADAVEHLLALAGGAAPVYLWGPSGSGKTHLLHALARRWQAQGGTVGWFAAGRGDADPALQPGWAGVLVDGCEALDATAQHAVFRLFVDAQTHGVPFVAAGRLPPVDLAMRDDLRTRLAWGHVFALKPLAEAETRAVLRRDADRRGIFLSDEVMDYLLNRFPRDLASLTRALDRLDRFGLAQGRRVTLALVRQMLNDDESEDA